MPDPVPEARIETWFLIPLVRNSDQKPHVGTLWGSLRDEVYAVAGGWSGPKKVVAVIEDVALVPGGWRDPATEKCSEDESRKYTVLIAKSQVGKLSEVLVRAANSFDQEEILFLVQGGDRSVKRDPSKGFLMGDPAGG
jgi:hypothetical protein